MVKMVKISKPNITMQEVFAACTENMHAANKKKYALCLDEMVLAIEDYEEKMEQGTPHEVALCSVVGGLPYVEVEKLYKDKLAKLKQPARKYYDQIIDGAPRGICPYCGQRIVSTLDHYFSKAHYVSLVIAPSNLIPACADCNKNKLDAIFAKEECTLLNPYYEDLDQFVWLKASLCEDIQSEYLTMSFFVDPYGKYDLMMRKRLEYQFITLNLDKLYRSHAAGELIGIQSRCLRIYKAGGDTAVKSSIYEFIQDNEFRPNSWQSAMYRALDSEWLYNSWLPNKAK